MVCEGTYIWVYSPDTGIYSRMEEDEVRKKVFALSNAHLADGRRLNVSYAMADQIMKTTKDLTMCRKWFHDAPDGLTFANGFATVKNGKLVLEPLSCMQRSVDRFDFNFDPETQAAPQKFLAWLHRFWDVDGEKECNAKIAFLQEWLGATLFGAATSYEKAIFLKGEGHDGKLQLIHLIKSLFPEGSTCVVPLGRMSEDCWRAKLIGMKLNAVAELAETEVVDSSAFKSIVSGDQTGGRAMRQDPIDFYPIAGNIFSMNKYPPVQDTDKAFRRRCEVIWFNSSIPESEKIANYYRTVLAAEKKEIVAWAIQGYQRLLENGTYTVVPSSEEALDEWFQQSDNVRQWISTCTIKLDAKTTKVTDWTQSTPLYKAYEAWTKECNNKTCSSAVFGDRVKKALGIKKPDIKRHPKTDCIMYPLKVKPSDWEVTNPIITNVKEDAKTQEYINQTFGPEASQWDLN